MKVLVVFESMYGNTHAVAEHIAAGFSGVPSAVPVVVRAAADVTETDLASADLLVVGAPTHARRLPTVSSRLAALQREPFGHRIDDAAYGAGVREMFAMAARMAYPGRRLVAAFDTRVTGAALFTGRASTAIARCCRQIDWKLVVRPESFLVDHDSRLLAGEAARAERWGRTIAEAAAEQFVSASPS